MVIDEPERKALGENIVPMINVVFLLLIFFLMTATISPPEPFEVAPPESRVETPAEVDQALYVGPDGELAWGGQNGDSAITRIAASRLGKTDLPPLLLRADRTVDAKVIAGLLRDLATVGVTEVALVAVARK